MPRRAQFGGAGGGGGASVFTALTDCPASYVGQAAKIVRVNAGETALEFTAIGATPTFEDNETPGGAVDGVNAVFTLAFAPNPGGSLLLFLNGVAQRAAGVDYTLAGSTITYVAAPQTGDVHRCWYRR